MAKIVQSDNLGMSGELPGRDEHFLLWSMSPEDAAKIVDVLNSQGDDDSRYIYKVVADDYKLKKFEV